jgi:LAO/AO transport system kinase
VTDPAADALAKSVREGAVPAVARAVTVVENDPAAGDALLRALSGSVGKAHRVGVTGPPGAGKSTLVAALAKRWRDAGKRVGVIAVDPTSPFTGGALLGDRVRMGALANDPGVYVRSLATRGALGGLSRAAQDACDVLDAAGYDPVVVETAGVGQSEVAVAGAADTVVVVVAPGSGDGVQALKGGLFEAADLVVVNQGDRDGAQALASEIAAAVELRTTGAKPKVMVTVATDGTGVAELHAAIDSHGKELAAGAGLSSRRAARARARVREAVESRLVASFWNGKTDALDRAAADVAAGKATVAQAAAAIAGGGGVR